MRWECKDHVVIIPKFGKKMLYGQLRRRVGRIREYIREQEQREGGQGDLDLK